MLLRSAGLDTPLLAARFERHTAPPMFTTYNELHLRMRELLLPCLQMFRTKFREVNVGMGHVDQHLYPPGSQVYPVESLYLELPAKCRPQAPDVKTTYRASFPAASST
jgi:hypothetical protein